MCTLILAWQVFPDGPVAVAANRDERLDRPSRPPSVIAEDPAVLAPLDEEGGGTWIGTNEAGVFVAITNRWTDVDLAGDRSRGLLVRDALGYRDAEAAARYVEREVGNYEYDGFILVVADANAAILVEWDGSLSVRPLQPGLHVVMNVGADETFTVPESRTAAGERQIESARRIRERLQPEPGERVASWLSRARDALGDHDHGVCVHGDGYGTRSSSLVVIDDVGRTRHRFADGPPCRTAFEAADGQI